MPDVHAQDIMLFAPFHNMLELIPALTPFFHLPMMGTQTLPSSAGSAIIALLLLRVTECTASKLL